MPKSSTSSITKRLLVVERKLTIPQTGFAALACEIALGPLIIKTQASLDQVSELILRLVREYREVPAKPTRVRANR